MDLVTLALSKQYTEKRIKEVNPSDVDLANYATKAYVDEEVVSYVNSHKDELKGADGRGIVSINKTGTNDNVDTYTITYTDGSTSMYEVTNGAGGNGETTIITDITSTKAEVSLENGYEYRYSQDLISIAISLPEIEGQYTSTLVFQSGDKATVPSYPNAIKWIGDDVISTVFRPVANKIYTIVFLYDGEKVNAVVRSVTKVTQSENRLPAGYKEIQCTGVGTGVQDRGIDTGVMATSKTRLEATVKFDKISGAELFFGGISAPGAVVSGHGRFAFGYTSSISSKNFYIGVADVNHDTGIAIDAYVHDWVICGDGSYSIDANTGKINCGEIDATLPIHLFGRKQSTKITSFFEGKIYGCKIYEDGVLIRDYVPCYRESDGVNGLYDLCGSICAETGTSFYVSVADPTYLNIRGLRITEMKEQLRFYAEPERTDIIEGGTLLNDNTFVTYLVRKDRTQSTATYDKWSMLQYDLNTGKLINSLSQMGNWKDTSNNITPFRHGNDMTYNTITGKLYTLPLLGDDIIEVDTETLNKAGTQDFAFRLSGIQYVPELDKYIACPSGGASDTYGGDSIIMLNNDFTIEKQMFIYKYAGTYEKQGIYADSKYVYIIGSYFKGPRPQNCVLIYKHDGTFITQLEFPGVDTYEFEWMGKASDGTFYIGTIGKGDYAGSYTQILSFKLEGLE